RLNPPERKQERTMAIKQGLIALALTLGAAGAAQAQTSLGDTLAPGGQKAAPAPAGPSAPAAGPVAGKVQIAYSDVANGDAALAHARDVLMNTHALEEFQRFMSPLKLPADVTIEAKSCGANFEPYVAGSGHVSFCYEGVAQILKIAAAQTKLTPQIQREGVVGAIVETLFHESAYALFDVLHVPVWGRVDDAADRLAALGMVEFGSDSANVVVHGVLDFLLWSQRTWTGRDFASAQSPEAQRFENFACIAVGADIWTFYGLVKDGWVPKDRAQECQHEYLQVRHAFNLRVMPYVDPDLLVRARAANW
ncbi:MAG: hypothetical protein KGQ28_04605, partial [Hyphomicrobiales bacterium]|nr:hypothetical protein [Hyphomicrobiales bacterium]